MFVEMYKPGGQWSRSTEKIIKIVADKQEKETFKDEPAYILKLYERDFENVTVFWFWLCSCFA